MQNKKACEISFKNVSVIQTTVWDPATFFEILPEAVRSSRKHTRRSASAVLHEGNYASTVTKHLFPKLNVRLLRFYDSRNHDSVDTFLLFIVNAKITTEHR